MRIRLGLLVLVTFASGCATVHAYERGKLADPVMAPEPVPEATFLDQHFIATVEASAGGYGVAGGGCGCN